jgi:hypothetical protein
MEIHSENGSLHTSEAGGNCSKCGYSLPRLVDSAPHYFENGCVVCQKCGEKVDLWRVVSSHARTLPFGTLMLTSLGAATTRLKLSMETGRCFPVHLEEHGVSAGAKILSVVFTPHGGSNGCVGALLWHGNMVPRRIIGTQLQVMAIPLGEGQSPRTGDVTISIIWIRKEESDGWIYLLNAFEAWADQEYAPSIVFAQSAVEVSLMPLLTSRLNHYAEEKYVKGFTHGELSFANALNVVLPNLCGLLGIPRMPHTVLTALNRLREKRNKIIHKGTPAAKVTSDDMAEGLSAAALGFEYMRYIQRKLSM